MDREQAERFVVAAEADWQMCVGEYMASMRVTAQGTESRRYARADVLAAQQVREQACNELRWAQQDQREAAEAEWERRRRDEEAALRAHEAVIRERRRRECEDRTALDRAAGGGGMNNDVG